MQVGRFNVRCQLSVLLETLGSKIMKSLSHPAYLKGPFLD